MQIKVQSNIDSVIKAFNAAKVRIPRDIRKVAYKVMFRYRKKIVERIRRGGYDLKNNPGYLKWKISRTNLSANRKKPLISTGIYHKSFKAKKLNASGRTIVRIKLGPEVKRRKSARIGSGPPGTGPAKFKTVKNTDVAKALATSGFAHLYREVRHVKAKAIGAILMSIRRRLVREFSKIKMVG